MPTMDTVLDDNQDNPPLLKLLLGGDSKDGKNWYAALAAIDNLNILHLDGDVGSQTVGKMVREGVLTRDQASRILILDMKDKVLAGEREPTFWDDMFAFISATKGFMWNDRDGRTAIRTKDHDVELLKIDTTKLDHNTLLIIDSWTALTESIMMKCAGEAGIDLMSATMSDMRPIYQGSSLRATEMLRIIRSLPCHCIVLAHPDEYQHKVAPEGKKVGAVSERDLLIAYTKKIPKTTSKPQGLQMGKYFSDVAWITKDSRGKRLIDFTPNPDRIGGGHFDGIKSVEEYSIANLIRAIGGQLPKEPQPMQWLTRIPPGEAFPPPPVLDGTKQVAATGKGLQGFNVKKPA